MQAPLRGALSPPAVWPQGVLFYKSESTESDTQRLYHTMGWLILNFPIVLIGKYHIPLLVSGTVVYPSERDKWYPHALQPHALTVD